MARNRVFKGQTRRGKRFLEKRAPKVIENDKMAMVVKGGKTNETVTACLRLLYLLKKPLAQQLKRRNPFHPFDDDVGVEKFSQKLDSSLFLFGSNSKKHPNSLIFGRMFDHHVLDMAELRVERMHLLPQGTRATLGVKPCLVLQGDAFQSDEKMQRVGNLLLDWFRGARAENVRLQGLELVIAFTAVGNDKILMRTYRSVLKKSTGSNPRVELVEVGPHIDFSLERSKLASDSLFRAALKQPQQLKTKMRKNTSNDVFGTTVARIHVGKQNVDTLQTRKVKALRSE